MDGGGWVDGDGWLDGRVDGWFFTIIEIDEYLLPKVMD